MPKSSTAIIVTAIASDDGNALNSLDLVSQHTVKPLVAVNPIGIRWVSGVFQEDTELSGKHGNTCVTTPNAKDGGVVEIFTHGKIRFHPPWLVTRRDKSRGGGETATMTAPAGTATT